MIASILFNWYFTNNEDNQIPHLNSVWVDADQSKRCCGSGHSHPDWHKEGVCHLAQLLHSQSDQGLKHALALDQRLAWGGMETAPNKQTIHLSNWTHKVWTNLNPLQRARSKLNTEEFILASSAHCTNDKRMACQNSFPFSLEHDQSI